MPVPERELATSCGSAAPYSSVGRFVVDGRVRSATPGGAAAAAAPRRRPPGCVVDARGGTAAVNLVEQDLFVATRACNITVTFVPDDDDAAAAAAAAAAPRQRHDGRRKLLVAPSKHTAGARGCCRWAL